MSRCADCGFFSFRRKGEPELHEVNAIQRERGTLPVLHSGNHAYPSDPVCFMSVADLRAEREAVLGKRSELIEVPAAVCDVIQRERDCPSFVRWMQGFSPKEHKKMILEVEQRKADAEAKLREKNADRIWNLFVQLLMLALGVAAGWLIRKE